MPGVIRALQVAATPCPRQSRVHGSAPTPDLANYPSRTAIQILAPGRGLHSTRRDAKSRARSCAAVAHANRARVPALPVREYSRAESRTTFLRGVFDA